MPSNPTFVFGDRAVRPPKGNRAIENIIGDIFSTQGFVGIGILLQSSCSLFLPHPYAFLPGAIFITISSLPNILRMVGLRTPDEESNVIVGRTTAYLDFADTSHVGKQPGSTAFLKPETATEQKPPKLALMLIGSQCLHSLGAVQPEFKEIREVFAAMIEELRAAPPEEETGFLNAEFYIHSGKSSNNSNMVCIYWRSYAHMHRFAHKADGLHMPTWKKYMALQRDRSKLTNKIGLWHEVFEISNAEAIYQNMPRIGLGDMWDPVPTVDGKYIYRNALVTSSGVYDTARGRLGYPTESDIFPKVSMHPGYGA